jgi:hypothetical protein
MYLGKETGWRKSEAFLEHLNRCDRGCGRVRSVPEAVGNDEENPVTIQSHGPGIPTRRLARPGQAHGSGFDQSIHGQRVRTLISGARSCPDLGQ